MRFTNNAEFGNNRKHLFTDELLEILQAAREDSVRNHAILVVCYSHSLRASEVCNLRLADLNLREKTIRCARLKSSMETVQPLFQMKGKPALCETQALRLWLSERVEDGGEYLFNSQKACRFHPSTLTRLFAGYCQRVSESRVARGLSPIPESLWHLHTLRHTSISHVIQHVENPVNVQQLAGHKNIANTMIYAHPSQREACREVLRARMEVFS